MQATTEIPIMEGIKVLPANFRGGDYLVFNLGDAEFGIRVESIRAVMALAKPEGRVPDVINLRGTPIPLVDLRSEFGFPAGEGTNRTSVLVVQAKPMLTVGLVVDAIIQVISLNAGEIEDAPQDHDGFPGALSSGISNIGGTTRLLIDINRLWEALRPRMSGMLHWH
jgi:purine-binding chemotaxis protein CheW